MTMKNYYLGEVMNFNYGKGLTEPQRQDGEVNVYGSAGIVGKHNESLVNGPGIIVGRKGNVGSVFFEKESFFPIDTVYYVILKNDSDDIRYIFYLLKTLHLNQLNSSAAVPGLNREAAYKLRIKIHETDKQKIIASTLGSYDDLIENNLRRIELLEKSAELLYKEWFVNLKFPGHEKTKIVNGIPEGWERGNIGIISKVQSGFAFKSKDWLNEGNPVIKIKNIDKNNINITNCDFVNDNIANAAINFLLIPGDLLIAMTGATVGKIGIMPRTIIKFYLNQRVGIFRKINNIYPNYFLFCFLKTNFTFNSILNFAGGAAQPNISPNQIESIEMIKPSDYVLNIFNNYCEPIFEHRLNLLEQNTLLNNARDLLLPKLINGEIEV